MTFKADGNTVSEDCGKHPVTGEPMARAWSFNDPVQAQKHAAQFQALGLSSGDMSAVCDAANETKKQLSS